MNSFQRKLIATFKSFVKEEKNLDLDFRTHVFLDNQYGATPCYNYSDAEIIIDCMFDFFDKYHVDYSGRYNRSMSIESLRTEKLNNFLLSNLEDEIDEDVFNAMNTKDSLMNAEFKIKSLDIEDQDCGTHPLCITIEIDEYGSYCAPFNLDGEMHDDGLYSCDFSENDELLSFCFDKASELAKKGRA